MRCEHADGIVYELKAIFEGGIPVCERGCVYRDRRTLKLAGEGREYHICKTRGEIPEESSTAQTTPPPTQLAA